MIHLHCLFNNVDSGGLEEPDYKISNMLQNYERYKIHWLG